MAKGVLLGVIGCVTVLPTLILLFGKPLQKTRHRPQIGSANGSAKKLTKAFPAPLVLFVLLAAPAYMGYGKTNNEVYYDLGQRLLREIEYVVTNSKLSEEFDIASPHMVLVDSGLSARERGR